MARLPSPEEWKYTCPRCAVEATMVFPASYTHDKEAICPGCDLLMDIVDYPPIYDKAQSEDNVIDFSTRLALRKIRDAIRKDST